MALIALVTLHHLVSGAAAATVTLPTFSNPEPILLPGGDPLDPGPGSIYPSTIQVSGVTNGVVKATVTVRNISHTWPDDIDLLLVGPQGQTVLLMSDCGLDNQANDVTITFDDDAAQSVPFGDPGLSSGTFRPTNDGSLDDLPAPAPTRPFGSSLSIFNDGNPNGTWALYAVDDQPENSGFITDGWSLTLTVGDPIADLVLTQTGPTTPVFVGSNLTYTITVTNRGPAITTAQVQDALPASQSFVSATSTIGGCTHNAGTVTCNLGNLLVNQGARITIVVSAISGATSTNVVTVTGNQLDQNPSNNVSRFVTSSIGLSDIAVNFGSSAASALLGAPSLYSIVVTNHGPNQAGGVTLTNLLPATFTLLAVLPSQGTCSNTAAQVSCSLGTINSSAAAVVQVSARANSLGTFTNTVRAGTTGLDLTSANNSAQIGVEVIPSADLAITAYIPATNVVQGEEVVSIFAITNRGPNSTTIQFTDPLPAGFAFVSASTTHGSCANIGGFVDCNLGVVLNGEVVTVTVVHRAMEPGSRANVGAVSGSLADPDSANNSASVAAAVSPAADVALIVTDISDPAWLGENLLYRMVVTNRGLSAASSVVLANTFPADFTFIALNSTHGGCTRTNNEVNCALGSLAPGTSATVNLTVRPTRIGLFTNIATAMAAEPDPIPQNNSSAQQTKVITSSGTFRSSPPIMISEFGPANPYPSTLSVSGLTGAVSQLRVTLTNLNHSYSDDLDLLLVGPQGHSVLLMSDAGGDFPLTSTDIVFDDAAANLVPDSARITSGIYRASNHEINPDTFSAPAPSGPYSTNLSAFRNTDPNGTWSLYVMDDAAKDSGSLIGGWGLAFYTEDPLADVGVSQASSANPVAVGTNLVLTYTVTNRGPTLANNVRLTNALPANLSSINFVTSQGSCGNFGGIWICSLGSVAPGGVATVHVTATPTITGEVGNLVGVGANEIDAHPGDNSSILSLGIEQPPVITSSPGNVTVTNGAGAQFTVQAIGAAPLTYQWQRNGINLPGATNAILILASVAPSNSGLYRAIVANRVGMAVSASASLVVQGPPFISDLANLTINENTSAGPIPFVVTDAESPATAINVTASSSDPTLVAPSGINIVGNGTDRTLTVTPATDRFGMVVISLRAVDPDGNATTNSFLLTVNRMVEPPIILFITLSGTSATFAFTTEANVNYLVEYKESLNEATWTPLRSVPGTGAAVMVTDALAVTPARFYRVRVE